MNLVGQCDWLRGGKKCWSRVSRRLRGEGKYDSPKNACVVGYRYHHRRTKNNYRGFSLMWPASMQIYRNKRKSSTSTGLAWNTNMATVSLFWNTNVAAVTSCENALYFSTATLLCYCLSLSTLENIKVNNKKLCQISLKIFFRYSFRYLIFIDDTRQGTKMGTPKVLLTVHKHAIKQLTLKT